MRKELKKPRRRASANRGSKRTLAAERATPGEHQAFQDFLDGLIDDHGVRIELPSAKGSPDRQAARRRDSKTGQQTKQSAETSSRRARAIIQAGVELANSCEPALTAKVLWDRFRAYTPKKPYKVSLADEIFQVWRDGDHLCERRTDPLGSTKQIRYKTLQKKPYYYPAIRARLDPE